MGNLVEMMRGIRDLVVRKLPEPSENSRVVIFTGVTEQKAADGGILRVAGANFERLKTNPIFKWAHSSEVIGRILKWEIVKEDGKRRIDFAVEFMTADLSLEADRLFRMVMAGYLRAVSIGFFIDEFEELTENQRAKLELGPYDWVAKRWTPYELSLVDAGSDPGALKRALESGELREEDLDSAAEIRQDASMSEGNRALHENTEAMRSLTDALEALSDATEAMRELAGELRHLRSIQPEAVESGAADSADAPAALPTGDDQDHRAALDKLAALRTRLAKEGEA